jgi:hypothetical protein
MRYAIAAQGSMIAYRAKDCIAVSMGGGPEKSITDDIYNLFPHEGQVPQPVVIGGQTIHPPDDTKPNAQTITLAVGYIYYDYQDVTGVPRTLVYDVEGKGWSVDTYTPAVNCHLWEIGPNVNNVLCGCIDGTVRAMGTGGGEAGTAIVMTRSENGGDARADNRVGDVFLKALITASNPITVALWASRLTVALTGFAPTSLTGTGTLAPYIVDFSDGFGEVVDDIALQASWDLDSGNILDLWQPDWVSLPENTQDRPTDWDDMGSAGADFIQGLILEADTFGQPKAISVQSGDDRSIHIPNESPVTFNGQSKQALTFTPPFVAHSVRIVSTDGVPWRHGPDGGWSCEWVKTPFPESTAQWQTEFANHGMDGWLQIAPVGNISHISTADLTLTLVFDHWPTITITIPNSGGVQRKDKIVIPQNKFKLVSYRMSSPAPFRLFASQCEIKVGEWGRTDAFVTVHPFGGPDQTSAEV